MDQAICQICGWCAGFWITKSKMIVQTEALREVDSSIPIILARNPGGLSKLPYDRVQQTNLATSLHPRWWQLKYFSFFFPLFGGNDEIWLIFFKTGLVQPPTSITWIWTIWVTIKQWLLRCQVIMTLDRRCRHRVPALVPFGFPTSSPTLGLLGGSNSQRAGFVSFQMGSGNLKKPEGLPGLPLCFEWFWKMKGTFEDVLKRCGQWQVWI